MERKFNNNENNYDNEKNRDVEYSSRENNYQNKEYNNQQFSNVYDEQQSYQKQEKLNNFYQQDIVEDEINNNKKNKRNLLIAVPIAFILGGICIFGASNVLKHNSGVSTSSTVTVTKDEKENEQATITAISKAKDAVVSIVNYQTTSTNSSLDSILGGITGKNTKTGGELKAVGSGSGVIYKKDASTAYIVTNNHVISGAKKIGVVLSDGTNITAELVGTDIWTDLSVLKIDSTNVKAIMDFANSDNISVGQTAYAIGSPLDLNLSNTVTKGIVSAVNRQIPIDIDKDGTYDWNQTVIQTDAAINPGNSGGALINNEGQLIGINELKISSTGSSNVSAEGIGFVIPSNEVKIIAKELEENGSVRRAGLGVQLVSISSLDNDLIKSEFNYDSAKQGVIIRSVESGSAANLAGLKQYDIITKINGEDVKDVAAIRKYLFEKVKIGDNISITYYRNGKENTINMIATALKNS